MIHSLIAVESGYRADALSVVRGGPGAAGLTQLMPRTAADLGVTDRFDPAQNIGGGTRYLAAQIQRFGDLRLALAAFNSGPERVAAVGRVPNIPETRAFVDRVMACYAVLLSGQSIRSAADCTIREAP